MMMNKKTDRSHMTVLLLVLALLAGCSRPLAADSFHTDSPLESESVWGFTEAPVPIISEQYLEETPVPEQNISSAEHTQLNPVSSTESEPVMEPVSSMESEPVDQSDSTDTEERIEGILKQMSLEEKAAQLFVVTPEALTGYDGTVNAAGDLTREAFKETPVGGIVYLENNLENADQTREMLSDMQEISLEQTGLPVFLCVDEEGGTVARISGCDGFDIPEYPDMCDIGSSGDTNRAREIGEEIGTYLSDLGFNVDFAPVADVWSNEDNTVVEYRAFSSDPEVVASMTAAFSEGLSIHDVLYCYKHFPGHGNTASDSHDGFAQSDADLETLRERELIPFQDGIERGTPMIMVGHISLPNVASDGLPASLSADIITDLLRDDLGYDGIVITDALNMGAIADNYASGEAAVLALEAGADLLLMPYSFSAAFEAVVDAVRDGTISETRINESITRILRAKLTLME